MGMLDDLVALQRALEKEPQRRDGLVDGRHANTACRQMQLIPAHVLAVSGERPRNAAKFLIL
jgi:hypothetical protein